MKPRRARQEFSGLAAYSLKAKEASLPTRLKISNLSIIAGGWDSEVVSFHSEISEEKKNNQKISIGYVSLSTYELRNFQSESVSEFSLRLYRKGHDLTACEVPLCLPSNAEKKLGENILI